jgi:hypothetical protein
VGTTKADIERASQGRQRVINYLADMLTEPSCPLTTEQVNHLRMVTAYFPEGRETAEKIDRIFADKRELRKELYLATIVSCLDRLLNDPPPTEQPAPVKTLKLASGQAIAFGSVVAEEIEYCTGNERLEHI